MIYLRGNPKDFDSLAKRLQDPIWSYESVQNFYKKFEDFNDNSGTTWNFKYDPNKILTKF